MRKTETRTPRAFLDATGVNLLLNEARMDERRGCADVFAARLERLALHITGNRLGSIDAAELLRDVAQRIQNDAQESC
ncbi:DUF2732 family protein [Symbiopectobacterium sp. RP]|uniref:DUF2732 family protein n=1 Tax=Symbiopectobacterium sp. RP TaxID=3248553 RepID=UPI003D28E0EB